MATAVKGSPVAPIDLSKAMKDEVKADPKPGEKRSESPVKDGFSVIWGGDLDQFADRLIAIVTDSGYIQGIGAYRLKSAVNVAFVPEKRLPTKAKEPQYCISRLLDSQKGIPSGGLVDRTTIGGKKFTARVLTEAEVTEVTKAVADGKAKFEIMQKERVGSILEKALKVASEKGNTAKA